uniref:Pectinesterase inhibitor domain-containing protein n=1 Tax=Setaria viridis TaxID=4556 RepID=A0A4U6U0R7_SETVI|nr:LOW QUALITY PROTEIN: hypothetical protein SEVIR_6G065900v2 [Setaria viridis]
MVKKRAAAMTKVLALSVVLAALFIAGAGAAGGCLKVPTMTWSDACLKACSTPAQYNLCQETLLHSPDSAEATIYALAAVQRAKGLFDATMARADQLLRRGGGGWGLIPGVEREAYLHCIGYYTKARSHMAVTIGDMSTNCHYRK